MRVAELVLEILARHGVRHVFGVPGDAINDITFALTKRNDMDFVLVRHEEAGAFAASAQAKLTGRLGCCVGTAGGGAVHLLNGLYDAKLDHAPVIAITGQVATEYVGTGYHQEVDLERLFADVAVYSRSVMTVEQLPGVMLEACKAAIAERGVAHINIPTNVAGRKVSVRRHDLGIGAEAHETRPCVAALETAAALINDAQKIAILAGIGAAEARADVLALADKLSAPVVRTLRAKDWIDEDQPCCIGGLGLLGGAPGAEAIEECDALIIIGADFPYTEFYPKDAKIIQIETDPRQMAKRAEVQAPLQGDAHAALECLLPMLEDKTDRSFFDKSRKSHAKMRDDWAKDETSDDTPLRPQRVLADINRLAPDDAIFLCDTGTCSAWCARHLTISGERRFTLSSGLGTMAFALPGAIGAQLAFPDRPVVAIAGDGAFAMLMADFVTAVRYDLPITCIVLDNAKLGFIALEQEAKGLPEHSIDLLNPDFAAFAEACGGVGHTVSTPDELEPVLNSAFANGRPTVVRVMVDPDALILPPKISLEQAYHFGLAKTREFLG